MEKQIKFRGTRLNYVVKGDGPAVVLLHGFLEDHSIWNGFTGRLSEQYKILAIDLPGFGNSNVFSENHSMPAMAEAVACAMAEEKIDQCIMVGHSMGGYVTLAFADQYPAKLKGFVLFHSQAEADDADGKINRDRTIDIVKKNHKAFITSFIPLLFAEENVNQFRNEITDLQKISSGTSPEGIIAALAGMRDRKDSSELLKQVDIPVFFIIGKSDSRMSLARIMPQLELPKNCEALILDGVGHMGFIEAKDLTYKALEHFIERNR